MVESIWEQRTIEYVNRCQRKGDNPPSGQLLRVCIDDLTRGSGLYGTTLIVLDFFWKAQANVKRFVVALTEMSSKTF